MRALNISRPALALAASLLVAACDDNSPPEILPIGDQTAHVGARFELRVQAYDPDGDPVGFAYSSPDLNLDNRARLYQLGSEAIFAWTPVAADVGPHVLEFVADDGSAADRETVQIIVKAATDANTAPVFRKPLGEGTTINLSEQPCISLQVEVEDPDSVSVTISQHPPIAGSRLTRLGPMRSTFDWCPSAEQATQQMHVLRLVADDRENPVVRKNFTLIIRTDLPTSCPGAPPAISHSPVQTLKTVEPIVLEAKVTDDKGLKGPPTVYYTGTKPQDPSNLDYAQMQQATMQSMGGDSYRVQLDNPAASLAPGASAQLHYVLVAEDDDDSSGPCDHRVQLPDKDIYTLTVTRPAGQPCSDVSQCNPGQLCDGQLCVSDGCNPQDTNGDGFMWEQGTCPAGHFCPATSQTATSSHCVPSCVSDADCTVSGAVCKVFETKQGCALAGTKGVGDACSDFTQCAGNAMCMPWPGGYCSISDCDSFGSFSGPCPSGSYCIPMPDDRFTVLKAHWLCMEACNNDSDCRTSDGYTCQTTADDMDYDVKVCML